MNLSAWWAAWKFVAILGLLLAGSVYLNVTQWADHRAYRKSEGARLEAAAMKAGLKAVATIAVQKGKDSRVLLDELARIAERARTTRVVYRQAADKRPLPMQCAPGRERMDAVNAGADP